MRPSRVDLHLRMAQLASERSTCLRRKVGAVITDSKSHKILALGYNGSLRGHPHCIDEGCILDNGHCVRAEHAEVNAIACLDRHYDSLTLYSTDMPCLSCLRILLKYSVKMIYFERWYQSPLRDSTFLYGKKDLYIEQYIPGKSPGFGDQVILKDGVMHYDRIYLANDPDLEPGKQVQPAVQG